MVRVVVDKRSFFSQTKIFFALAAQTIAGWSKKIWQVEKEKQHVARYRPTASSTTGEIRRILSGGESHQAAKGGLVFVATFLLTYLLLAMVRPRAVVYKRGEEEVPRFRPGAAMLWALAAGTVGIGLCLVDR